MANNIKVRLDALERAVTFESDFPNCGDDFKKWLDSLEPRERERVRAEARERAQAWELEMFGEIIAPLPTEG